MDLSLFKECGEEVFVLHCNFTKGLKSEIILFSLFINFSLSKHGLKVLRLTSLGLVLGEGLVEILQRFDLKLFFGGG